jgi:hypothetical protein
MTSIDVEVPPAATGTTPTGRPHHGVAQRGLESLPSSPFTGRFGRMFRELPVFDHDPATLSALAGTMIQDAEPTQTADGAFDEDENPARVPAGYTYFGQFIDHDITFDPVSSLDRQNDPDALVDFRSPRFDLDNLYGRGPDDQPYLYDHDDPVKLRLGEPVDDAGSAFAGPDLPRDTPRDAAGGLRGVALIGDPRNDENLVVSQLQVTFIKFHNRMVDKVRADKPQLSRAETLKEAQRLVRWHYQWAVVYDFLPRVVGPDVVDDIFRQERYRVAGADVVVPRPRLLFYDASRPYIPVEFSVAAYRFGHSMIRPNYHINDFVRANRAASTPDLPRVPIFSDDPGEFSNLNGFRRLPPKWGIQWKYFFEMPGEVEEGAAPKMSYKIDAVLSNPLAKLPQVHAPDIRSLAERNLLRGRSMGLPSGQRVAQAMGITPLTEAELGVEAFPDLAGNDPLWHYILKEAEVRGGARTLGPVGGRIVAEVLIGLLAGDPLSYVNVEPGWTPDLAVNGSFGVPELIAFALS